MTNVRLVFLVFCVFLGLVIYTADMGTGDRYWGWLRSVPMGDKVGHCCLMFVLSLLANLSLRCRKLPGGRSEILLGTVIVVTVVLAEEVSQIWIPGRSFDLLDVTADLIGIGCGDLLARIVLRASDARSARRPDLSV